MTKALDQKLITHIKHRAKTAGVHLDTYDADWFVGVAMQFLDQEDAALTSKGVRRFKRGRGRRAR